MVDERSQRRTRTDEVYERIREDIYGARLKPGQRLKFPEICASYDTSVGVAREALVRLAGERLVRQQAHHGYTVADLSFEQLADLTAARVEVESLTFRKAILEGDDHWESGVVAAHHFLARREFAAGGASDRDATWYEAHESFHKALLAGCSSERLREVAQMLRAEAELYRHWAGSLVAHVERDLAAEHRALADAAVARDAELGADLLRQHIAFTSQILAVGARADAEVEA